MDSVYCCGGEYYLLFIVDTKYHALKRVELKIYPSHCESVIRTISRLMCSHASKLKNNVAGADGCRDLVSVGIVSRWTIIAIIGR